MRSYLSRAHLGLVLLVLPSLLFGQVEKPRRAAFLQSLAVPGWGQYSLGKKNAALAFFGTELLLIGGMYTFHAYGASAEDDYKAMAAAFAGVTGSHGHDYYVDVGNWMNVDDFNERRLQERNFGEMYVLESDRWEWDSDQHRAEMRVRRIKSDQAYNSALYLIGGVVLNHIASAIHAGRASARRADSGGSDIKPPPWAISLHPADQYGGLRVSYTHAF